MGRKKKKSKVIYNKIQREPVRFTKTTGLLNNNNYKKTQKKQRLQTPLSVTTDLRRFHPERDDNLLIDGRKVSYIIKRPKAVIKQQKIKKRDPTRDWLAFTDPRRTAVCIRRKSRRRILFKMNKVGKGKKVTKYRRYNENSKIRC